MGVVWAEFVILKAWGGGGPDIHTVPMVMLKGPGENTDIVMRLDIYINSSTTNHLCAYPDLKL